MVDIISLPWPDHYFRASIYRLQYKCPCQNTATLCQNNGLGMQDLMDHCVNQSPI